MSTANANKFFAEGAKFREMLRTRRNEKKIRQSDIASAVGINSSYYSHIENGIRVPSECTLWKIAKILEFNEDEIKILREYWLAAGGLENSAKSKIIKCDSIHNFLVKMRSERNYLQGEMAELLGMSDSFYNLIENENKRISINNFEKIKVVLNLSEEETKIFDKLWRKQTEQDLRDMGGRISIALKYKRKVLGYTQPQMAQLIGCSPSYYSRIENGERVHSLKMLKNAMQLFSDEELEEYGSYDREFVEKFVSVNEMINENDPIYVMLRKKRQAIRLCQINLGKLTGISHSHISSIESGKKFIKESYYIKIRDNLRLTSEEIKMFDKAYYEYLRKKEAISRSGKFGKLIRFKREQMELTQQAVSNAIGISDSYYCSIEVRNETPSEEILEKIRRFYNLSEEEMAFVNAT